MSELQETRDHARRMATAEHTADCLTREHAWLKWKPRPGCRGCVTDAYLTKPEPEPDVGLWP